MNQFVEYLNSADTIVLDGAMGTMLMAAGLSSGGAPEEWNVSNPDPIRAVHRDYIAAGSRLILTNSFGGTRFRLEAHDLGDRVIELNRAAAEVARAEADSAPFPVFVAGSMGPTGELMAPLGSLTYEDARDAFAEQAQGLTAGGVDVLWVETMSDLNEVKAAVEGARSVSDLPIVATMSFDTHGRTMMGTTAEQAAQVLGQLDLLAMGANCGANLADTEAAVQAMHEAYPQMLIVAKANAGIPNMEGDELVYDGTPEVMGAYAQRAHAAGARLIGACCGSSAAHIQAIDEALN